MTAQPADAAPPVRLHPDEADDLARVLGRVEDWLLHADPLVLHDLDDFAAAAGWHHPGARLVDELGACAAPLHRQLRAATPRPFREPR